MAQIITYDLGRFCPARSLEHIVKNRTNDNLYLERDPVKVVARDGSPMLLVELENSLMKHLSGFINFVPSVYANESAIKLLRHKGLIPSRSPLKKKSP